MYVVCQVVVQYVAFQIVPQMSPQIRSPLSGIRVLDFSCSTVKHQLAVAINLR